MLQTGQTAAGCARVKSSGADPGADLTRKNRRFAGAFESRMRLSSLREQPKRIAVSWADRAEVSAVKRDHDVGS